MLSRLHEEEKSLRALQTAKPKNPSFDTEGTDDAQNVSNTTSRSQTNPVNTDGDGQTLVERMFGGRLSTGIRCLQCHSLSEKDEPFTDLSLAFCPSGTLGSSAVHSHQGAVNGGSENSEGTAKDERSEERPKTEAVLSLSDLLEYFLAPEILEEENSYFCERCSSLQRAERVIHVVTAPEYLILTLLRFSYDATCHVRRKILDNVGIPLHMHLPVHQRATSPSSSSFSSPPPSVQMDSPESGENLAKKLKPSHKEKEEEDEGLADNGRRDRGSGVRCVPYVLCSVVMHSGMSSESGHYYSYGRNMTDAAANPTFKSSESDSGFCHSEGSTASQEVLECAGQDSRDWFLFNDSRVTFTNFQSVQNITSRFPKDTAYVLIYRKQEEVGGQAGGSRATVNGSRFNGEPPLHKDLMDAITKDNKLFLQVRGFFSAQQKMTN